MKVLFELFRRFDARRVFGLIRRLGGMSRPKVKCYDLRSTHALRVEGDAKISYSAQTPSHFYPRPPGGGRQSGGWLGWVRFDFYPRPPGGGRPRQRKGEDAMTKISIHALRVEGDAHAIGVVTHNRSFLSTPSGWRATWRMDARNRRPTGKFLSTPSGWRATFGGGMYRF